VRAAFNNLLLATASCALFLAVLEGGSRALLHFRPEPQRADYLWDWEKQWQGDFYTLASDESGWPPGAEFNGDGVRDRRHAVEKPERVARVVFLGDSVTFGHGLEPGEAYPQVLQSLLDDDGRALEVFNVGLWGWSTRQERIAYERLVRRYRPDRTIVAVCLNDVPEMKNNLQRPPRWLLALHERLALVRLLVNAPGREIQSVEELFTRSDSPKVREGYRLFFAELRALRDLVAQDGGSLALLVFPFRFQLAADAPAPMAQAEIAKFCEAERLACLDLLPALRREGEQAFLDYDHLSAAGARFLAGELLRSGLLPETRAAREVLAGRAPLLALLDRDPDLRAAACWSLGRGDAPAAAAVEALSRLVETDASERVRAEAARALGRLGAAAQAARPVLARSLLAERAAVRGAAADALDRIGYTASEADALVAALDSADEYVRGFATYALGELGSAAGERAALALAERVRAQGGAGRSGAARALSKMGGAAKGAVPLLIVELQSEREQRRWRAARTLGRIGPDARAALPALLQALQDPSAGVRVQAARSLGRIGSRDAIAGLVDAIKRDPAKEVREEASRALSRIPGT
jgi:HEAT repeat protein/lysophospholipase L1-like esterase